MKVRVTENGVSFEKYGHTSDALDYIVTKVCETKFRDFERISQ